MPRSSGVGWAARLALALVALSGSLTVKGQTRPNGFYLTTPLSMSWGYDSGFLVNSQPINDTVTLLAGPTVAWIRNTHRTVFSVDYKPEYTRFTRTEQLNRWSHFGNLRLRHQINSRYSLEAGNVYLSTTDSSRHLGNSLLMLPMGRFQQNSFYTTLGYRWNQSTRLSFRGDNAVTTTKLRGVVADRLNQVTTAGTATVGHWITRHHKIEGNYSFLRVHPLSKAAGDPSNVHLMSLVYSYELPNDFTVLLSGGIVSSRQSAMIGAAAVEKRLGGVHIAAGYQRYVSFFGGLPQLSPSGTGAVSVVNGLTPSSVYQVGTVRGWGQLTRRLGMELTAQRAVSGADAFVDHVRSFIGQARLDYRLTERLVLFARSEYYGQNSNLFSETPLSRRRYFAGLEIVLSRPPESNTTRPRRPAPEEPPQADPLQSNPSEEIPQ